MGQRSVETVCETVGLIPAAGNASRLGALPFSKEMYPIGLERDDFGAVVRPKMVCEYLLEGMSVAGIRNVYFIIQNGKWDIPGYLVDGSIAGLHIAYIVTEPTCGVPFTINRAIAFVCDKIIAFGFPDVLHAVRDPFSKCLRHRKESGCDVVLGLFPADRPEKTEMVELNNEGRISGFEVKPKRSDLAYTWDVAVWSPTFTEFMDDFLRNQNAVKFKRQELVMADLFRSAIEEGLSVEAVHVSDTPYVDIGTVDDLERALRIGLLQV